MPPADVILAWATRVANDWQWLAMGWHGALAALLLLLVARGRPSRRIAAAILVLPLASVSLLAAASGNPFNAVAFALLVVLLTGFAAQLPPATPVTYAPPAWRAAAIVLVAFGWAYPHFLVSTTWAEYLYASPFGLLPCPTLSVVLGLTLLFGGFQSTAWTVAIAAAGLLYGWIGVVRLGVVLDSGLLAGAVLLLLMTMTVTRPAVRLQLPNRAVHRLPERDVARIARHPHA
jgi:hypothetical protein